MRAREVDAGADKKPQCFLHGLNGGHYFYSPVNNKFTETRFCFCVKKTLIKCTFYNILWYFSSPLSLRILYGFANPDQSNLNFLNS